VVNSRHDERLGDHNLLDVNDLSVRNNLAIEDACMSPPRLRSAKKLGRTQTIPPASRLTGTIDVGALLEEERQSAAKPK
jgi:hypothetical protein